MIRSMQVCDVLDIMRLGHAMHKESPVFKDADFDNEKVSGLLMQSINTPNDVCVFVNETEGQITGGIIGFAYENWFGPQRVASDVALFVSQDKRGGLTAARLIQRYEKWAKAVGCYEVTIGTSTGVNTHRTSDLYKRLGYSAPAHSFRKRL